MTFPLENVRKSVNPTSMPTYKEGPENVSLGCIFSTSYVMQTNHFPFSFRIVASLILPSIVLLCLTSMYPILFKRSLLSSYLIEAFIPFLVLYSLFLSVMDRTGFFLSDLNLGRPVLPS